MGILAALWMVVKQISRDFKLELCLLFGLIIGVAVISSIPIYTEGSLQFALYDELKGNYFNSTRPAHSMMMWYQGSVEVEGIREKYEKVRDYLEGFDKRLGVGLLNKSAVGGITDRLVREVAGDRMYADIYFMTNYEDMIEIVSGRLPAGKPNEQGEIEAIVDLAALDALELIVGEAYEVPVAQDEWDDDVRAGYKPIRLRIVGAYKAKEEFQASTRWVFQPPLANLVIVNERAFIDHLMEMPGVKISDFTWYWIFEYRDFRVNNLGRILAEMKEAEAYAGQVLPGSRWWISPIHTVETFNRNAQQLKLLLFTLTGPIIAMLIYYIVLTSGLLVARRQNIIVTMRSRGAGLLQLVASYALEWFLLGAIALATGPVIGMWVARIAGASSDFLQFVGRVPLPVRLTGIAYRYGLGVIVIAFLGALVPVILSSKHSIVSYKQEQSRSTRPPFWQKIFLDVILLGVTAYGYRALNIEAQRATMMSEEAAIIIEPSLFLIPAIAVIAAGLFALRLFPFLVRFMTLLTQRWSGVPISITLYELGRNPGQYRALMLLLIVTTSMGIYSSSTARTMNQNQRDRLAYAVGADAVIETQWRAPGEGLLTTAGQDPTAAMQTSEELDFSILSEGPEYPEVYEPPFYIYNDIEGVEAAARVLKKDVDIYIGNRYQASGKYMAIDPVEYSKVAWFRRDLVPFHRNQYLNLLISNNEGVIVSKEFCDSRSLKPGDWIRLRSQTFDFETYILATVEYWPTLYPDEGPFIIGNINYQQQVSIVEPYNVWLKLGPDAKMGTIVEKLREEGVYVIGITDLRNETILQSRQPQNMAFSGMLSIGFIVSVTISIIGLILYTLISLKKRAVQYGVLRTIGLSVGQLIQILALEQLFTVGTSILLGTCMGYFISKIFLPFIQISAQARHSIPEFRVVVESSDILKIYAVFAPLLVIAMINFIVYVIKLKPYAAIKLGEDV